MANIVLGIGTSHGPMLVTDTQLWNLRVPDDRRSIHHYRGRTWTFEELVAARRSEKLGEQTLPQVMQQRHAACQTAIDKLATAFAQARPDIAVIIGNDQMELFNEALIPAFSVFWGEEITNTMYSEERLNQLPPGIAVSVPGYIPQGGAIYPGQPELGRHLIECATRDQFDVASMKRLPRAETPHAFGFVYRRIMCDQVIPSVPVLVNTFYPPNQPTVRRCYEFGKSIVRAIQSWPGDARVALIASGGLTHFVIDEDIDQAFFAALKNHSIETVAQFGEAIFQAGTSEMKNWVPVAGAMAELGLAPTIVDYVPCYRSEAGTGNAMAFVYWRA